jgi:glyoxylase-like metal-dependent hydrolase (beta-lactamase superfamily II)
MALPFALDHINLWLLRDEIEGRARAGRVVDCCITRDERQGAVGAGISPAQLEGLPMLRVIVTHMHPDHIGLAHWLCERWNAPLWISATDYNAARIGSQSTTGFGGESAARFLCLARPDRPGRPDREDPLRQLLPAAWCRTCRASSARLHGRRAACAIGGHAWRCISGYGHAPEHMALYCDAPATC